MLQVNKYLLLFLFLMSSRNQSVMEDSPGIVAHQAQILRAKTSVFRCVGLTGGPTIGRRATYPELSHVCRGPVTVFKPSELLTQSLTQWSTHSDLLIINTNMSLSIIQTPLFGGVNGGKFFNDLLSGG